MELNFQHIKEITLGACTVEQTSDGYHFYRYTPEQMEMFIRREQTALKKYLCTSGVALRFRTDSRKLTLKVAVHKQCSRNYFAFDLLVNGQYRDCLRNYDPAVMVGKYVETQWTLGEFTKTFDLEEGEKELELLFPWSVEAVVKAISLDDGATLTPVKPQKTLLTFGDSITQGYDALNPSNKYITRLAHHLGAQEVNKGYGGEVFWPELGATREDFIPDYITVAYGTNDWNKCSRGDIEKNCPGFYKNLAETYPNTPIFAITPLWRQTMYLEKPAGAFTDMQTIIADATRDYPNITVIPGMDLIPHSSDNFADLTLHPNDTGFAHYFENLKPNFA